MYQTQYAARNTQYDFAGKVVLVMGLGRFGGGVDTTKFAVNCGAKVIVTDLATEEKLKDSIEQLKDFPKIEFHLGSHDPADFEKADIIIANPAVVSDNEFLKIATGHNKFVTSQISIFFELCPATIIGITGSNGKSTTAALTAHLLKAASDENVWLSGNIGNEPLLTILDKISPNDLVVLEISSFQIDQLTQIQKAPKIALLTNLTPNHLDRYGTFDSYCATKESFFKFQKLNPHDPAISIFNADDKIAIQWFEKYKKDAGRICIKFSADDITAEIRKKFSLPGRANLSNLAAAIAIARHFGINDQQVKNALPSFRPLSHRLELVARKNGICWFNDSKATTPQSTIAALEAFEQPIIIIAGGYDKKISFDELAQKIAQKAKAAILIGQTAPKIAEAIKMSLRGVHQGGRQSNLNKQGTRDEGRGTNVEIASSLARAIRLAYQLAESGDVVLLSPACASYDMFDNFEQRGREFAALAQKINR